MRLNKSEYKVNGLDLVVTRGIGHDVAINYDDGCYEWDAETNDTNEVRAIAEEMYLCIYDVKGTNGDVDEIYQAIMAFEN